MATGSNNAYRLSKLLVDGGTYLARELTLQEIDKQGFTSVDAFLNDTGIKAKLAGLQRKNILKRQQMTLLYPTSNNVEVEQLDITLLTCILTNCFNLSPSQVTLVKDLRELRNTFYGHAPAFSLDDAKFRQNWKAVVTILESGSNNHLKPDCVSCIQKMIKDVESEILTPDMGERYIKQLIEWHRTATEEQNISIRGHIAHNQSDIDSLRRHWASVESELHGIKVWLVGEVSNPKANGVSEHLLEKTLVQNEEALQTIHEEKKSRPNSSLSNTSSSSSGFLVVGTFENSEEPELQITRPTVEFEFESSQRQVSELQITRPSVEFESSQRQFPELQITRPTLEFEFEDRARTDIRRRNSDPCCSIL